MRRIGILLAIFLAGAWAIPALELGFPGIAGAGGVRLMEQFFAAALEPAWLHWEGPVPEGAAPLWTEVFVALRNTLVFALAACSLGLICSLPLALAASRLSPPWVRVPVRVLISLLRSVHELIWAVLLLAAMGLHPGAGVVALAVPYAGTLARVFADMLDETPDSAFLALRQAGAGRLTAFGAGLLPRAAPDMAAYSFYRFECSVRSAAVLGFFGFETLGYHLKAAFDELRFHEVWTWLWAMILLVVLLEIWSSRLRRRFVA